jgi:xanthine dehydrogenase accessory factor
MTHPDPRFHAAIARLYEAGTRFALATVVAVRGSASGKPGAKAIFDEQGRNIHGWVGGGCIERFVGEHAIEALACGQPRVVVADLDDELLGLGMPCGGTMDVYVEPVSPRAPVWVAGDGAIATKLVELAARLDMRVVAHAPGLVDRWHDPLIRVRALPYAEFDPPPGARVLVATSHRGDDEVLAAALARAPAYVGLVANRTRAAALRERLLGHVAAPQVAAIRAPAGLDIGARSAAEVAVAVLAEVVAEERGVVVDALEHTREAGPAARPRPGWSERGEPELVIVGLSRISEALAELALMLGWPTTLHSPRPSALQRERYPATLAWISDDPGFERLPAGPRRAVIVGSHHKGDELAIATALRAGAPLVGLIASAKRSRLIRERLDPEIVAGAPGVLRAPVGLDLGASSPAEIALSIVAELLALHRERSGHALATLDRLPPRRSAPCPDRCAEER